MVGTTAARNASGQYVCPECGEAFDTPQAYGGHMTGPKHATTASAGDQFSVKAEVAESLRGVAAPLQVQLDEINARI
jgi:hypothetical protein